MAETMNAGNTPENLSPEEMLKRRAEITAYYEDNIPSLKTQLEYEELLRDIEKTRAERLQAQMFITKSMAEPPAAPGIVPGKTMPPKPAMVQAQQEFNKAAAAQGKKQKAVKDATN
tara:strand:+ start:962 stop:1309 length:348 start_codon:yes stop_codon:yes gene_type:complete